MHYRHHPYLTAMFNHQHRQKEGFSQEHKSESRSINKSFITANASTVMVGINYLINKKRYDEHGQGK